MKQISKKQENNLFEIKNKIELYISDFLKEIKKEFDVEFKLYASEDSYCGILFKPFKEKVEGAQKNHWHQESEISVTIRLYTDGQLCLYYYSEDEQKGGKGWFFEKQKEIDFLFINKKWDKIKKCFNKIKKEIKKC